MSAAETVTLSRLQFFTWPLSAGAHALKHSCIQLPVQELKLFSRKATKRSSARIKQLIVLEFFQIILYLFVDSFFLSVKKREGKKDAINTPEHHATSCWESKICYLFRHTDLKKLLLVGLSTANQNTQNHNRKWKIRNFGVRNLVRYVHNWQWGQNKLKFPWHCQQILLTVFTEENISISICNLHESFLNVTVTDINKRR